MKVLRWLNLLGVLILAGLCVTQWFRMRDQDREIDSRKRAADVLEARLAEQDRRLEATLADLESMKSQAIRQLAIDAADRRTLEESQRNLQQATYERDQLRSAVSNWTAAVSARDLNLQQMDRAVRNLTNELAAAVQRHNQLATNYNRVVEELNGLRRRPAPTP